MVYNKIGSQALKSTQTSWVFEDSTCKLTIVHFICNTNRTLQIQNWWTKTTIMCWNKIVNDEMKYQVDVGLFQTSGIMKT